MTRPKKRERILSARERRKRAKRKRRREKRKKGELGRRFKKERKWLKLSEAVLEARNVSTW